MFIKDVVEGCMQVELTRLWSFDESGPRWVLRNTCLFDYGGIVTRVEL